MKNGENASRDQTPTKTIKVTGCSGGRLGEEVVKIKGEDNAGTLLKTRMQPEKKRGGENHKGGGH